MVLVLVMAVVAVPVAHAQDSLSIGVQSTLPIFQLTGTSTSTNNLVVITNWKVTSTLFAHLSTCAYMTGPMTGTGNNTDTISENFVQVNGASIVTGSTNCGIPSATPIITNQLIWFLGSGNSALSGSRSNTLGISISGYPSNLEPDTYTGTIYLIASVQ
jgi:hypothetical protein